MHYEVYLLRKESLQSYRIHKLLSPFENIVHPPRKTMNSKRRQKKLNPRATPNLQHQILGYLTWFLRNCIDPVSTLVEAVPQYFLSGMLIDSAFTIEKQIIITAIK